MNAEQEEQRLGRLEAEADIRPRSGRCLGCGKYRVDLQPGRRGGWRVYCEICAIASRTPSQRGRYVP